MDIFATFSNKIKYIILDFDVALVGEGGGAGVLIFILNGLKHPFSPWMADRSNVRITEYCGAKTEKKGGILQEPNAFAWSRSQTTNEKGSTGYGVHKMYRTLIG
jgi:hypothetical protein